MNYFTDENFSKKVVSADMAIVYFYSNICPPCSFMEPVFANEFDKSKDKLVMGKIDVGKNQIYTRKYGIKSVPSFVFLRRGEVEQIETGIIMPAKLSALIDSFVELNIAG